MVFNLVGWGRSFVLAFKVLVYSIFWYIIGGILVGIGVYLGGSEIIHYLQNTDISQLSISGFLSGSGLSIFSLITSVLLIIIGSIIIGLGATASLIKVTSDASLEDVYRRRQPLPPPPREGGLNLPFGFDVRSADENEY